MTRYLESLKTDYWRDKKVIELGAGTGISSLMLGKMNAHVTVTDKRSLLPLIEYNIKHNLTESQQKNMTVDELFWGTESEYAKQHFDVIIGADLTYDFEDLPALIKTMTHLTEINQNAEIFLAYGKERAVNPNQTIVFENLFFLVNRRCPNFSLKPKNISRSNRSKMISMSQTSHLPPTK